MREQIADALSIVRPSDRLCNRRTDVDHPDLRAPLQLVTKRYRVGHNDPGQAALVECFDSIARQDAVRDNRQNLRGAVVLYCLRGLGQRSACIGHIIHENCDLVLHVADEHHAPDLVRPRSLLVNECEGPVETIGDGRCSASC